MAATRPQELCFTEDAQANELLAREPFALLVGFALDQQVPVQTAFTGPLKIRQRLGTLAPKRLAVMDPARLEEAFRQKPAVHRFPGTMAQRVHELAQHVADEYGGDAERLWADADGADDLRARIAALPGFGEMKIKALGAVLAKRFGVRAAEGLVPNHPTLGDVDSVESLHGYQAAKRAYKATLKRG